jgi:anti-sigma factor RsiW
MIDLSDEVLMAYVDGQLDKPQVAVVGRLLREDRDLAFRVSRLQQTQAQLLDTFGALLREGMSTSAGTAAGRASASKKAGTAVSGGRLLTAGTAGLLLLLGASAGFTGAYYSGVTLHPGVTLHSSVTLPGEEKPIIQSPISNWPEDMAEFHSFFTKEAVGVSPESQSNPDMVKFQLAQLAKSGTLPDFSAHGLKFVRGQMLSYRGNKVMQLIYMGRNEPLVTVFIGAGGLDMQMSAGRFGDIKTVSWSADELRYVIASDMQLQPLRALAAVAQSQLAKK